MPPADFYVRVLRTTDVRNDADGNHDMGNVQPPQILHIAETYVKDGATWYRADNLQDFVQPGYLETWVASKDCEPYYEPVPDPEPEPEPPPGAILTDEAAGNAFVALVNWLASKFR